MSDVALVAGGDVAAPLGDAQWHEFVRRAELLGHDLAALERGAELVTYTTMESIPLIRTLCLATDDQRRRRQAVFFGPQIASRRAIGQGIHDRLECAAFADGEVDPADESQASIHFPFPTRTLSVLGKRVLAGESWDLSVRGDHWDLDDRDDILNVVNVGELHVEPGAGVVVRGNLLILTIQRLVCGPRDPAVPYHLAILPTPFSVDPRNGPLNGPDGADGAAGAAGTDAPAPVTRPTMLGPQVVSAARSGVADGAPGGDGADGDPGGRGRTGGATKTAEITIRELTGDLALLVAGGAGGSGGSGGSGGAGGPGGHGAPGIRSLDGRASPGSGGAGGHGGAGGAGGPGGNGGISSNVFVTVPPEFEERVTVLAHPAHGGRGGAGGTGGPAGRGGHGGAGAFGGGEAGADGRPGRRGTGGGRGSDGRTRTPPPVYVNERAVVETVPVESEGESK